MGVKKSTVLTMARSGRKRNTPASSDVSVPTSMSGLLNLGNSCKTCTRSAGPSLAAQPAALTSCVSRTVGFFPSLINSSLVILARDSLLPHPWVGFQTPDITDSDGHSFAIEILLQRDSTFAAGTGE